MHGVRIKELVSHIVGNKSVILTEEEKSDAWAIKTNLQDKLYTDSLMAE